MYDVDDEPEEEWIEIYNSSSQTIDLSAFKVGDEETAGASEGMVQFPLGSEIASQGVIVVANRGDAFFNIYGFSPDFEIHDTTPNIPDMIPYSIWGGANLQMSNSGDEVLLLDGNDNLVDALSWGNSTWAFNGMVHFSLGSSLTN
jgi:hypothetical protein